MKLIQSLLVFRGLTGQNVTTDDVLSWITSNITSDQSVFTSDVSGDVPVIVARAGAQERIRERIRYKIIAIFMSIPFRGYIDVGDKWMLVTLSW